MSENTEDNSDSIRKEAILTIVRTADESRLLESGNPVYLRLKEELNRLQ